MSSSHCPVMREPTALTVTMQPTNTRSHMHPLIHAHFLCIPTCVCVYFSYMYTYSHTPILYETSSELLLLLLRSAVVGGRLRRRTYATAAATVVLPVTFNLFSNVTAMFYILYIFAVYNTRTVIRITNVVYIFTRTPANGICVRIVRATRFMYFI